MSPITAILTHENPDLDGTLCIWLLKRFGASRYPNISEAALLFFPAGMLPDEMHPDELEATRGILAVDTGGGRLDTHARDGVADPSKKDKCAALLVAEDLELVEVPALGKLLSFVLQQEIKGRSIASKEPMDHLISLPNLLRGLNMRYYDNPHRVVELMLELYDAAYATELEWFQGIEDFKTATTVLVSRNQARLVAIESNVGAVLRVARMNKADLIIHRNGQGHTGITGRHTGPLAALTLEGVAAVVRTAEQLALGQPVDGSTLREVGLVQGWYLHDSGRILSKGSPKNREVAPSILPLARVLELAHATLDADVPMPASLCSLQQPVDRTCSGCPFEALELATCSRLRRRERRQSGGGDFH